MKRLTFSGLSVLLVMVATAPAFAAGKPAGSDTEICQSLPPAQPTGGASRERLEAIQRCEAILGQQQAIMAEMKVMGSQRKTMELQMKVMESHMEAMQKALFDLSRGH